MFIKKTLKYQWKEQYTNKNLFKTKDKVMKNI